MFNFNYTTMKKMLMIAAMAVCSATAFAQDDLVKQAEKQAKGGDVAGALATIAPALTSNETVDKAKAWNTVRTINMNAYDAMFAKLQEEKVTGQTPSVNEPEMYKYFVAAYEAALKCDEFDRMPNEKGKIKMKYRKANGVYYSTNRVNLISAGQHAYNAKDFPYAIKCWKLYVDAPKHEMYTGIDMSNDKYYSEICYYVALASYQQKDYAVATEYALIAAQDTSKTKDANEIILFSKKDGAKTKSDSLDYLNTLKKFHELEPNETRYFNLLMDYYGKPGRQAEMLEWLQAEVKVNPNNSMLWAFMGENHMHANRNDEAIAAYKKALEIDPSFVQVQFNLGVTLNSKAIELKDQLADKNTGGLTKENADKVKAILNQAKDAMLKARDMDPNREKVNWVYPLYQIYYALGEEANAAEMEKMLNN